MGVYAGGSNDYIFLSVLAYGAPIGSSASGTASLANGCVIGYNVNSGTISGGTLVTGMTAPPARADVPYKPRRPRLK
ncbi:MAG TPA: hypothetical protein VJX30_17345 [Terriglobales bacterium]|nr:hypothetical protein [Terriglobales bacterium]